MRVEWLPMAAALLLAGALARAGEPVVGTAGAAALFHSVDPRLDANKQVVHGFLRQWVQVGNAKAAGRLLSESYIEHDPRFPSGRDGAAQFLRQRQAQFARQRAGESRLSLVAVVAEDDLVAVIAPSCGLRDPKQPGKTYNTIWADIWRVNSGKLAEHWDTAVLNSPVQPSYLVEGDCLRMQSVPLAGDHPVLGAPNPDELFHDANPALDRNKQVAYRMIKDMVEAGHWELAETYATERYIQHNPMVPTGRDAAIRFFTQTIKIPRQPIAERLKMSIAVVIAEGDYVVVANPRRVSVVQGTGAGGARGASANGTSYLTTWVDLWRMKDGRADEHWDGATLDDVFKP